MSEIKTNGIQAWLLASRPKTLAAAATPVIIGCATAYQAGAFQLIPALICLLFALLMQIAANLINDLIDFEKGTDGEERLGPLRATAQGWITPKAMKTGIAIVCGTACAIGLCILFYTTWHLILVGLACVVFAYFYTSGPYPLSYNGWGDVAVVVFFGLVPTCMTYYVQTASVDPHVIWHSIAVGLVVNGLLVVNNYRDRDTDKNSGKKTLIVKLGEAFGRYFYLVQGLIAAVVTIIAYLSNPNQATPLYGGLFLLIYVAAHISTWKKLSTIRRGKELNKLIGETSRNMLVYSILVSISLLIYCK